MRGRHSRLGEPTGVHIDIRAIHRANDPTRMDQPNRHPAHTRVAHERDHLSGLIHRLVLLILILI